MQTMNEFLESLPLDSGPRNRCHYCDQDFWLTFITKDHIVPKSRGGRNVDWNYVPACQPCNFAKNDDLPTCNCRRCQTAFHRSEVLVFGTRSGVGRACENCGCITMTPWDCPWCFNGAVLEAEYN